VLYKTKLLSIEISDILPHVTMKLVQSKLVPLTQSHIQFFLSLCSTLIAFSCETDLFWILCKCSKRKNPTAKNFST